MSRHNELGKLGEEKAAIYLTEKGYQILCKNYRSGRAEVDIIASFKNIIVFVEVKTRSSYAFGYPEESVSNAKQELLTKAASNYMFENGIEKEVRFDIIAIFKSKDEKWFFKQFEDAFFMHG